MKKEMLTILDIPGCVIELSKEAAKGKGEDACGSYLHEDGCSMAVFDGCGGSGARTYSRFHGKTGAYIAARKCRDAYFRWYKRYLKDGYIFTKENMEENLAKVKTYFLNTLTACKTFAEEKESSRSPVAGSIMRSFPSTVSAILCDYYEGVFSVGFLWAGNSRGYILNGKGLSQVTQDDIFGDGDAMDNLRNDDSLSNVLCADGDFAVRGLHFQGELPLILITATDGCFDYLPSPMHFEYMLLSTMQESADFEEWRRKMDAILAECSADDYSLVMGCFGYRSFDAMKQVYAPRTQYLRDRFMVPLSEDYKGTVAALWQEYKPQYYRRYS